LKTLWQLFAVDELDSTFVFHRFLPGSLSPKVGFCGYGQVSFSVCFLRVAYDVRRNLSMLLCRHGSLPPTVIFISRMPIFCGKTPSTLLCRHERLPPTVVFTLWMPIWRSVVLLCSHVSTHFDSIPCYILAGRPPVHLTHRRMLYSIQIYGSRVSH
jgi:hypothetical protein